jgi:hypothetical protein
MTSRFDPTYGPDIAIATPTAPGLPDLDETATTVVALSAADTVGGGAAVLALLADLAPRHELAIVYAHGHQPPDCLDPHALVAALRTLLGKQTVVAVLVGTHPRATCSDLAVLTDLLDEGAVIVAVVPATDPVMTARVLGAHLGAEQVLRLHRHPNGGALSTVPA